MTTINFSRELIKGKIAEMIFEQMLQDVGGFTVLGFGYEKVLPDLARAQNQMQAKETMKIIRRAPDFAIINHETNDVHLIEVKYRKTKNRSELLAQAEQMHETWKPSHLFLATPKGFYFGSAADIVARRGDIAPLVHTQIPTKVQEQYLKLMNEFIGSSGSRK